MGRHFCVFLCRLAGHLSFLCMVTEENIVIVQHSTLVHNIYISCILHLSYQPFRDAAIAILHTFRNVFVLCVAAMCKISIGLRGRFSVWASVVALASAGS